MSNIQGLGPTLRGLAPFQGILLRREEPRFKDSHKFAHSLAYGFQA